MRARKLVIGSGLLFAVAISAISGPALAQQAAPAASKIEPFPAACTGVPASESDRAHKLYEAGKSYYDDATYDAAIVQFREAYKKDCSKHELLVIISRAYELKGDKAAAITALETYLERVPSSPDAAQHKNRIENLKKKLAEKQQQQAAAAASAAAAAQPTTTEPPPPAPSERRHTVAPWIVVGVGGAAVVVGAIVLATAPSLPELCDADTGRCTPIAGESTDTFEKRKSDAGASQNQPTYGIITMAGGGALVLGGLLWHFLEPTGPVEKSAKTTPSVTPQLRPGFAGLSLGGRF